MDLPLSPPVQSMPPLMGYPVVMGVVVVWEDDEVWPPGFGSAKHMAVAFTPM
jgi:hypothetical protein